MEQGIQPRKARGLGFCGLRNFWILRLFDWGWNLMRVLRFREKRSFGFVVSPNMDYRSSGLS